MESHFGKDEKKTPLTRVLCQETTEAVVLEKSEGRSSLKRNPFSGLNVPLLDNSLLHRDISR